MQAIVFSGDLSRVGEETGAFSLRWAFIIALLAQVRIPLPWTPCPDNRLYFVSSSPVS
jgi:hypothetical protein